VDALTVKAFRPPKQPSVAFEELTISATFIGAVRR
jgi:hypothetical protein